MLNLVSWQERLSALPAPAPVSLAADVEAAQATRQVPALLLVPGRDTVSHAGMHPRIRHRVRSEVLLISAVSRRNRPQAGEASDALATLRQPVLRSLINWLPPGCDVAVTWQGGRLLAMASHALFWVDVLATDYWWHIEESSP